MKRRRRPQRKPPLGFTLIELMITLVLLDVALLGLVSTTAFITRTAGEAAARQRAVTAARARLERLASLACAGDATGEAVPAAGMLERWTVSAGAGGIRVIVDSIEFTTRRGPRTLVLKGRAPC